MAAFLPPFSHKEDGWPKAYFGVLKSIYLLTLIQADGSYYQSPFEAREDFSKG